MILRSNISTVFSLHVNSCYIKVMISVTAISGPGSSKLLILLVNVVLKFQKLKSEIRIIFCLKNVRRNISGFGYKAVKHLISLPLNELVKLTML